MDPAGAREAANPPIPGRNPLDRLIGAAVALRGAPSPRRSESPCPVTGGPDWSALNYLMAYKDAADAVRANPEDVAARITFEKFDPTVVRKFTSVRSRAQKFAENLLKRQGANFSKIANELMDITRYPSHGQMIGWEAARDMGLEIDYRPMSDPTWRKYWALYCHMRLVIESDQRIFESNYSSLVL